MKIFKLFFQLLKEHRTSIILNTVLLLSIVIPVNAIYNNAYSAEFEVAKSNVGIINGDEGNLITENLIAYLEKHTNLIPVENDPEEIADVLYYQKADYILTVPAGFGESLLNPHDSDQKLGKTVTQAGETEAFVDTIIDRFVMNFQLASIQVTDVEDTAQIQLLLDNVNQHLDQSDVAIVPAESQTDVSMLAFGTNFLQFISYIMLSVFITTFGYVTIAMRDPEIIKRDRMGMIKPAGRLLQMLAGCIAFSVSYWLLLLATAVVIYGADTVFSQRGLLLTLNSFLCMFGIQALAYFVSTIANTKGSVSFFSSFLSLLLAFSSGLFVPRQFVGTAMQQLASFATPIWQVKTNEIIMDTAVLSAENLQPAFEMMGIQVLIGVAFYLVSFVYQKYRQRYSLY